MLVLPLLPLPPLPALPSLLSKLDRAFFSSAPAPDLAPATGLEAEAAASATALVSPVMSAAKDTVAPRSSTPCTHSNKRQQPQPQPQRRDATRNQ